MPVGAQDEPSPTCPGSVQPESPNVGTAASATRGNSPRRKLCALNRFQNEPTPPPRRRRLRHHPLRHRRFTSASSADAARAAVAGSPGSACQNRTPRNPRLTLGRTLFQLGDTDGAIDEYRTLALPSHGCAAIWISAPHSWPNKTGDSHDGAAEAARLDPTLVQAHYSMGTIHYTRGNIQSAIKALPGGLRLKPDFAEAHYRLGLVLKVAGRDKGCGTGTGGGGTGRSGQGAILPRECLPLRARCRKSQIMAITWWAQAFEQGLPEASQALTQLRRLAAVKGTCRRNNPRRQPRPSRTIAINSGWISPTSTGTSRTKPSAPPCSSRDAPPRPCRSFYRGSLCAE